MDNEIVIYFNILMNKYLMNNTGNLMELAMSCCCLDFQAQIGVFFEVPGIVF